MTFLFCSQWRQSFFESCSKLCVFDCEMTLFWQNLLKSCVFWPKWFFFLGIAGKNSRFCQNCLTNRASVMVIFRFFGSKWPQKRTTCICRTQNTYGTLKGRYQVNLQEKNKTIIKIFARVSETEAINLKKVASFFQDAIHFHPGHLQPKTLIFTIRALVE